MKRKYCIVSAQYRPHTGGVENYTFHLSQELKKLGNEVTILTSHIPGTKNGESDQGVSVLRFPSIQLGGGRFPIPCISRKFVGMQTWLDKQDFDIFVVNTRLYLLCLYFVYYAHRRNIPCMVIDHGTTHITMGKGLVKTAGEFYEHILTSFIKHRCKRFYGVSKASCQWLRHFGITGKGVLYNSIDYEAVTNQAVSSIGYRELYGIPDTAYIITFVGRLTREKGIMQLVEAFKMLTNKNTVLFVAGDGPLKEDIEKQKSSNTHLLGNLPHENVIDLLRQSDCFCLPSDSEGFATTVLEAAACECYVVTTKTGGTKEFIKDMIFGTILEDNRPDTILSALCAVLDNSKQCEKMAVAAGKYLKDHYTWKITADKLAKIIEEIVV